MTRPWFLLAAFLGSAAFAVSPVLPVLAAIPSAARPQPPAGKKYALVVGVNEYDNRKLANLKYAERDATELAKVLRASGFEVALLLGSSNGKEKASRANLEAAVATLLTKVTKRDTLLAAFAGHGQQFVPEGEKEEQPFFCPVDASPANPKTLFAFNGLLKKLDSDGAGTNLVLIDACRTVNDPNRGTRTGIDGSKAVALSEGTVVFFACSRDQEARETDKAGGGHGVFFHAVIDGLKGGAANRRGQVTWDGLVAHVKDRTTENYPEWFPDLPAERRQRPQAIGNLSGSLVLTSGDLAKKETLTGAEYTSKTTGMKFRRIKAEKFMMGSPKDEKDRRFDTHEDLHEVTLTKDYYLGTFEVTRGQFKQFVDDTGYKTECEAGRASPNGWSEEKKDWVPTGNFTWRNPGFPQADDHPVVLVTWTDAAEFCKWLSKKDNQDYRLPSEAEWEFACRAGSRTRFSFGDDAEETAKHGNVADGDFARATGKRGKDAQEKDWAIKASDGYVLTAPVGKFRANAFGLHDMHGNVFEWCQDYYGPYDKIESKVNPVQTANQTGDWRQRVLRGGCWYYHARDSRSAHRWGTNPVFTSCFYGFRVCLAPN